MNKRDKTVTIVSGLVVIENYARSLEKYFELSKSLLEADCYKVIFIDDTISEQFNIYNNENTCIIPFKKDSIYLNDYKEDITDFKVNTQTPNKDTLEYMFIVNNKLEFIRMAIHLNKFNTEQFIWVDFGIRHVFSPIANNFMNKLERLNNLEYTNVRIANIQPLPLHIITPLPLDLLVKNTDVCKKIMWYFAGGVFGGSSSSLIKFADLAKEMCIDIIKKYKTLPWEVNVWFLVYINNKDLFDPYVCNHNDTIIDNY